MSTLKVDLDADDITIDCPFRHDSAAKSWERRCTGPYEWPCDNQFWGRVTLQKAIEYLVDKATEPEREEESS